jgi:hypothetical protein
MPFSEIKGLATEAEWTSLFENVIKPSVEECGFNFECVRSQPTRGNIISDIVDNLALADLVIADLSGWNANVFYELGVRHALVGKTILLAQEKKYIPSDLQSYAYHIYECKTTLGKRQFRRKLKALVANFISQPRRRDNPVEDYLVARPHVETLAKVSRVDHDLQKRAVVNECREHHQVLQNIAEGRLPLSQDAPTYFQYFLDIINANTRCEKVCIFARLLNLEVRQGMKKFGFKSLFPGIVKAVDGGKVRMDYLVFLKARASLDDPDTADLVNEYTKFSERVSLLFENESGTAHDTKETFVLLTGHEWVLTHGWEYSGRISTPLHRINQIDYMEYSNRFRRLEAQSHLHEAGARLDKK